MNDMTLNLRTAVAAAFGAAWMRSRPRGGDGAADSTNSDRVVVAGGAH